MVVGALARRLMRGRPDLAVVDIAQKAEGAPVVARAVLAPAGDGEVLPAAVAAAGMGDHHVVSAVGQQLDFRRRRIGVAQHPYRRGRLDRHDVHVGEVAGVQVRRRGLGHPFLQQQRGRAEQRVRFEALLHRAVENRVGQREQAHAGVVGHERAHDGAGFSARQARRRVIDGFVEAVTADEIHRGEALQVDAGLHRRDHQGQGRGVGRDHQILGQSALEAEARHAEGAVLVVQMHVRGVVPALRNPPWHPA